MKGLHSVRMLVTGVMAYALLSFATSCGTVPEEGGTMTSYAPQKMYSIQEAFNIVAEENHQTRKLYTGGIVKPAKKNGFKFDEDWEKDEVEAGPLPALFLRGISAYIKQSPVPMGLYLGSDFPIRKSNKLVGKQAELFAEIRKDEQPKYFYDAENQLQTAMYPDFASATPCVSCHNEHPETTKTDWKMDDVMGATTWTYPADSVTFEEMQAIIIAYREGAIHTYNQMLAEIDGFKESEKPEIGDKWPTEGNYIPKAEVFMDSVAKKVALQTAQGLLKLNASYQAENTETIASN